MTTLAFREHSNRAPGESENTVGQLQNWGVLRQKRWACEESRGSKKESTFREGASLRRAIQRFARRMALSTADRHAIIWAMTDLLDWLARSESEGRLAECQHDLGEWLGRSSRVLADGWWHACDVALAYELSVERAHALGIDPPTEQAFVARHELAEKTTDDEEELRRHQLGFLAVHVNARRKDDQLFHCCGPDLSWESEEPPWVLLNGEEHRRLLSIAGPPTGIEAAYSGKTSLPNLVDVEDDRAGEAVRMAPATAQLKAKTLLNEGKLKEALLYFPAASAGGEHGLLARLDHIETLRRLSKTEEARALWNVTADEWIGGSKRIWNTQWKTLLALHKKLRLPDTDPRLASMREKAR